MDEKDKALIGRRLAKAKIELAAAKTLLAAHFYGVAAARAYYVIFNATNAALITVSIERSHKHSAVQAALNQYLVKPGLIEPEYAAIFATVRKRREDSDYGEEVSMTKEEAEQAVANAEKFVARMEAYLASVGGI
jgi:uncharacterized protein (UPF0332 family)